MDCTFSFEKYIFLSAQNGVNPDWEKKVIEYFKEKLKENNAPKWVPSLNEVPLHYLKPNSFVKFRCMVQDMFDPEFYMGVYETVNRNTKARVLHFGKYRDVAECGIVSRSWKSFFNPSFNAYVNANQARVSPSTSYTPSRHKRSYEDDEDMDLQPNKQKDQHTGARQAGNVGGLQWCGEPKRLETEASSGQQLSSLNLSSPFDLNFPLPGEKGPACLVKFLMSILIDSFEGLALYCEKPHGHLKSVSVLILRSLRDASSLLDPMECTDMAEEQRVHSPPASLVPRIHVVLAQKLQHINPLLPACLNKEESKTCKFVSGFMSELSPVRAELLGFLTHALLGDSLAAEYLILHLISTVPTGCTSHVDGREPLFLSPRYSSLFSNFKVTCVPSMTIENMNHLKFIPHKDYAANRLVSGLLQLPSNTSLVIDETLLEQGQLDTPGVHNVTALSNLITWQKVDYDFSYHQMEFPCNINVFITSEGRSLLPAVEDDFVEMRKNDPQSITADDLHQLLIVARFLSLSAGQTTLSRERWLRAKQLESLRRARLQQQKCVNGNEL
ncbi:MCMBP [Cervus elaphus hippelaphus]|uniref:Mini-chromosome maintenance complex-binding protein n=1 Tax=Cervus elaphus hippelaphus TaxID=46360 RepID=A0A212CN99_CEREH|nr:MCMBP [Cervus elaphus hippelaphus]